MTTLHEGRLDEWLTRPGIRRLMPLLKSMPPLPERHQHILGVFRDPFFSTDQAAYALSQDVCLTAQLLKMVNSTVFAPAQPVHDVAAAIQMLGVQRLTALISSAWALQLLDSVRARRFDPRKEWDHALAVAMETQNMLIAAECDPDMSEAAFSAALLHDLGRILIAINLPEDYDRISNRIESSAMPGCLAEEELLECNHAQIGAALLRLWKLPEPVVMAVAWHHHPDLDPEPAFSPLTLVHVANCRIRKTPAHSDREALVARVQKRTVTRVS